MLKHLVSTPKKIVAAPRNLLIGFRYHVAGIWDEACSVPGKPPKSLRMPKDVKFRERSFTYAVIALSARVACNNGALTREKYVAFRDAFPLQDEMCGKIRLLFAMACEDATPLAYYAAQVTKSFPKRADLSASIVSRLFTIANAGGETTREGERVLAHISHLLGLSAGQYTRIRGRHMGSSKPHETLGIEQSAAPDAVKKRYRELMNVYHPDRYAGGKISQELEMLLQLRSSEINAAYNQLTKRAA